MSPEVRPRHRIKVARPEHKFSCAHMTVFPDGRKERLHGHNYTVAVALELAEIGFQHLIDFAVLKAAVADVCLRLRERTLVAEHNPRLNGLTRQDGEIEFRLCGQRYVMPDEDALILPIDNTTTEALASYIAGTLAADLAPTLAGSAATALEVTVEESPGQGATAYLPL